MAGEAAMLALFAYFGLVFSTFYGAALFGAFPDNLTVASGVIITSAGIYMWYREIKIKVD